MNFERFYQQMLNFLEPQEIQILMNHIGGSNLDEIQANAAVNTKKTAEKSVSERFAAANLRLLSVVNKYVKVYRLRPRMFALYNLFRYKRLGLCEVVYEGAFYSNYLAGKYAGEKLKLY